MSRTRTRWGSVLAVVVIAPWMAEMSWGGIPFTDMVLVVLFLGPMYGGAALLIREVTRRTGRGWPTILLLAAAFGVLQAGIVDQSLFNPDYARYDFQHPVHVDGIDISLYHLVSFVTGHVVASISIPIVIAESWSRRAAEPWLSRRGLWFVGVLYVLASVLNHVGVKDEDGDGFQAAPHQVVTAMGVVALLVAIALTWRRRPVTARAAPPVRLLVVLGFLAHLLYLPAENAASLAVAAAVITAAVALVGGWSRSSAWTSAHTFWLAMGAALVGVVVPYLAEPYDVGVSARTEVVNDTAAALGCLLLVGLSAYRRSRLALQPA
ncbi:hypothetical protein [Aeromicrobium sp. NPDC092404]|uniref:hypothetical protein n=1 Tax=Aeromicrobium sp. NPDC092404 TaxID=3154976 RepID=UPI003416F51E